MMSTENTDENNDKLHSRYKRKLLRNALGGIFPYYWQSMRALHTGRNDASLNYLDGFTGPGSYDGNADDDEDISRFGSPIIAVARALEALDNCKNNHLFKDNFYGIKYVVHFNFNDKKTVYIQRVKELVQLKFDDYGWRLESNDIREIEGSMVFVGHVEGQKLRMKVTFFNREFEKLPLGDISSPLFSFVDPYGISQVPMESIKHLIGEDREIFLNLMVGTIDRNRTRIGPAVRNLYSSYLYQEPYLNEFERISNIKDAASRKNEFAELYFNLLNEECLEKDDSEYYYTKFAFTSRENAKFLHSGFLYVMGFASCKLSCIQTMKQAMMKVTDIPEELIFSYFHRKGGHEIPYERKSDDRYEAEAIWNIFKGATELLGTIKRRVLTETPFVYHSKALKYLEDTLRIIHVDSAGKERNMGNFCAPVSAFEHQRDRVDSPGKDDIKYGNYYKITFVDEELYDKVQQFLKSQHEGSQQDQSYFAEWVLEKMRLMREDYQNNYENNESKPFLNRNAIYKKIPTNCKLRESNGAVVRLTMTPLNKVLSYLVEEGEISCIDNKPINKAELRINDDEKHIVTPLMFIQTCARVLDFSRIKNEDEEENGFSNYWNTGEILVKMEEI